MEKNTFLELLDKYFDGSASDAEKQLIEEYYEQLVKQGLVKSDETNKLKLKEKLLHNILTAIPTETVPSSPARRHPLVYIAWIAATVVIILGTLFYIQITSNKTTVNSIAAKKENTDPLLPGTDKAVLTLSDGSSIVLDSTSNGTLAKQNGSTIMQQSGGHLLYSGNEDHSNKIIYNTLTTPRGGEYNLTLSDGTRVWLNAMSGIRYPVNFSGDNRTVEISGEAYFEVAHNKAKPFIVKVNEISVEVLGTHFNIMAYGDEQNINTTLLEGSVKIYNDKNSKTLQPGQQSIYNANSKALNVISADIEKVMAWKNGFFLFKGDDIKTIMRQVSRWYDVDVSFDGAVSPKLYSGSISRYVTAQEVLRILELAGIKFKVDGKTITLL